MHQHVACSVLTEFTAESYDFASRSNDFHAHDLVTSYAIFNSAVAASVGCNVTADEAGVPTAGVAAVEEAFLLDCILKDRRGNAGFGNTNHVVFIDFEDFVHTFNGDDDAAEGSNSTSCQARTSCTRNHDRIVFIAELNDFGNFFSSSRKNNDLRFFHVMGVRYFVMGIRFEFIFVRINILFADDLFELFNQLRGNFTFCHNTYLQIV